MVNNGYFAVQGLGDSAIDTLWKKKQDEAGKA